MAQRKTSKKTTAKRKTLTVEDKGKYNQAQINKAVDYYKPILKEQLEQFNLAYEYLYDNRDNVKEYGIGLTFGDYMLSNSARSPFLLAFIEYRQDYLTSDREVAQFGLMYSKMQHKYNIRYPHEFKLYESKRRR